MWSAECLHHMCSACTYEICDCPHHLRELLDDEQPSETSDEQDEEG